MIRRRIPTRRTFVTGLLLLPLSARHAVAQKAEPATGAKRPTWAQPVALEGVPNLHLVDDDFFRSAQPDAKGFQNLATQHGLRTVISLRAHLGPIARARARSAAGTFPNSHLAYRARGYRRCAADFAPGQAGGSGAAALPARRRPHRLDHGALSRSLPGLGQGRRARRNAERRIWLPRRLGQHSAIYPACERGSSAARGRRSVTTFLTPHLRMNEVESPVPPIVE